MQPALTVLRVSTAGGRAILSLARAVLGAGRVRRTDGPAVLGLGQGAPRSGDEPRRGWRQALTGARLLLGAGGQPPGVERRRRGLDDGRREREAGRLELARRELELESRVAEGGSGVLELERGVLEGEREPLDAERGLPERAAPGTVGDGATLTGPDRP